jgi:hypothetical protein
MMRRSTRRPLVGLAAATLALAAPAGAAPTGAEPGEAWSPALAAWGASAKAERADAEALTAAPVLVPVGEEASAATASEAASPAAEFERRDETERWVPSVSVNSGVIGQNAEGSIRSDSSFDYVYYMRQNGVAVSFRQPTPPATQCPRVNGNLIPEASRVPVTRSLGKGIDPFGGAGFIFDATPCGHFTGLTTFPDVLPTSDDALFVTPFVGSSGELMTPGLQGVPGRPRLFARAGVAGAFAFERSVAKEGVPAGLKFPSPTRVDPTDPNSPIAPPALPPDSELVLSGPLVTEGQIQGIGSETTGTVQSVVGSAGFGAAFTVDVGERRLRIKPSVEWMREEIEVRGKLIRAYQVDSGSLLNAAAGVVNVNSVYLPIDLRNSKTRPFNGIGPGLEIEMDAARTGPIVLSLFASGQAYKMLGDRDVELGAQTTIEADGTYILTDQVVGADWDFHIHSWSYQGGVGLRFRWLPED